MRPVVTPVEMAAIDAEAPEPVEELIARAGWATARAAIELLDRPYGSRVAIVAGRGNNGADGRSAVPHLRRRGVHCTVFDIGTGVDGGSDGPVAGRSPTRNGTGRAARPEPFDLIIDACYGTGLRRPFDAGTLPIDVGDIPVLAVDIPSGVDGTTGQLLGRPLMATATVTFAAPKPGLLLLPGRRHVGRLVVADIGLDCSRGTIAHLDDTDLVRWPTRDDDDHKWRRAVAIIGGGPGMAGAPQLAALASFRAGAGYVTVSVPGSQVPGDSPPPAGSSPPSGTTPAAEPVGSGGGPIEAVDRPVGFDWADEPWAEVDRYGAFVVGPGLADTEANRRAVRRWWTGSERPTVFDAGALTCLAAAGPTVPEPGTTHVITPHDGEFARLYGRRPGPDRMADARELAARLGTVVLLKGPTTVVADPDGRVLLSTAGDARLATAGTGDVLAGVIAAGLVGGLDPLSAAGLGAELHGRAARRGRSIGLVASDLPDLVAETLSWPPPTASPAGAT